LLEKARRQNNQKSDNFNKPLSLLYTLSFNNLGQLTRSELAVFVGSCKLRSFGIAMFAQWSIYPNITNPVCISLLQLTRKLYEQSTIIDKEHTENRRSGKPILVFFIIPQNKEESK